LSELKILILHYHHLDRIDINSNILEELDQHLFQFDPRLKIFKYLFNDIKIFALNCADYIELWSQKLNVEYLPHKPEFKILDLLTKIIGDYKPDIVYVTSPLKMPNHTLRNIKMASIKSKWLCYYGAKVYLPIKEAFGEYDMVVTGWKQIVDYLRKKNINTSYLPHFFDEETVNELESLDHLSKKYQITFAGAISHGGDEFNKRRMYLEAIAKKHRLTLFSMIPIGQDDHYKATKMKFQAYLYDIANNSLNPLSQLPYVKRYKNISKRPNPNVFISKRLSKIAKPPVFGTDYYQVINNSRIFLNAYIEFDACDGTLGPLCGNIRTFEVTGTGTCLLTENASNIDEFFEPDSEVVTYSSKESVVSKVKFLLDNPRTREEIAQKGKARAMRDHTLKKRIPQLREILKSSI
jgi:hypothetical protein